MRTVVSTTVWSVNDGLSENLLKPPETSGNLWDPLETSENLRKPPETDRGSFRQVTSRFLDNLQLMDHTVALSHPGKDAFMTAPPLSAAKMFFFVAKAKSKLVEAEPLVTDIGMTPYRFIWITPNRLSLFRHRLPLRCTWPLLSSTTSLAANGLGPRSAVAPRDRRRRAAGK